MLDNEATVIKDRTGIAIVCLHLSAVLYVSLLAVGVTLVWLIPNISENDPYAWYLALILMPLGLCMAIVIELTACGLRRQQFKAWVAGLGIFIIFVSPLLLPLGLLGLWGLLAKGSRRAVGIGR